MEVKNPLFLDDPTPVKKNIAVKSQSSSQTQQQQKQQQEQQKPQTKPQQSNDDANTSSLATKN